MGKGNLRLAAVAFSVMLLLSACTKAGESKEDYRLAGIEALNAGDYEAAISAFDASLEESRGKVGDFQLDVLKYRAEAEYFIEDYQAAAHTYDVLIQVDDELPEYLIRRSMSYAAMGEIDLASADYKRAKELDPQAVDLNHAMLALTAAMEEADGYENQALELYEQAIANGWENAEIYNRMGKNQMDAGNYEKALDCFQKGLAFSDEAVTQDLLFNQAVTYEYMGQFDTARDLFDRYIEQYGDDEAAKRELEFLKTR